jgi:hypothetical protein
MLMCMSAQSTEPAVVAFGDGDAVSDGSALARVRRIAGDWRISLGLLAVAGAAGFTSLIAPWFSMITATGEPSIDGQPTDRAETFRLIDIGAFGTAYLPALLVLAVLAVLVVFGPATVRPVARLSGLTLAGALVAVLVAFSITFRDSMERNFSYGSEDPQINLDSEGGLTAAYLSVVLAGLTLFLARPALVGHSPTLVPEHSWRPPRPAHDETAAEIAAAAPLDLTVQPSRPFARPDGDDDRTR